MCPERGKKTERHENSFFRRRVMNGISYNLNVRLAKQKKPSQKLGLNTRYVYNVQPIRYTRR